MNTYNFVDFMTNDFTPKEVLSFYKQNNDLFFDFLKIRPELALKINKPNKDIQYFLLEHYLDDLLNLKYIDPQVQMIIANRYWENFHKIKNPEPDIINYVLHNNPSFILYLPSPSYAQMETAVGLDCNLITRIKDIPKNLTFYGLKRKPSLLSYLDLDYNFEIELILYDLEFSKYLGYDSNFHTRLREKTIDLESCNEILKKMYKNYDKFFVKSILNGDIETKCKYIEDFVTPKLCDDEIPF